MLEVLFIFILENYNISKSEVSGDKLTYTKEE